MSSNEGHEPHEPAKRRIHELLLKRKSKRRHAEPPADSTADGTNQLDLLDLVLFVVSRNIPVPLNADFKPRDRWGLLDDGRSYMAYKVRVPDPDAERVGKYWVPGTDIVLKRTYASSSIQMTTPKQSRFSQVMSELAILWHKPIMEHENIIESLGVTWDIEQDTEPSIWPVLLFEYSECGSLAGLKTPLSFEQNIQICVDVANALLCLHSCGVAHCDVKSENVLLFVEYEEDGQVTFTAKLNDFGFAVLNISPDTDLPNGIARTKPWNAPEATNHLRGLEVFKTDIFSFGMFFWRVILNDDLFFEVRSARLEEMKTTGEILHLALATVAALDSGTQVVIVENVLKVTLPASPQSRANGFGSVLHILTGEKVPNSRY